jgi:hypothetical protein
MDLDKADYRHSSFEESKLPAHLHVDDIGNPIRKSRGAIGLSVGQTSKNHIITHQLTELGCGFLIYLLLMELSKLSTSTLECYASSIRALHFEVHNPKSLNQRVGQLRTLNILHHGIEILEAHFQQATALGLRNASWLIANEESNQGGGGGGGKEAGGMGGGRGSLGGEEKEEMRIDTAGIFRNEVSSNFSKRRTNDRDNYDEESSDEDDSYLKDINEVDKAYIYIHVYPPFLCQL